MAELKDAVIKAEQLAAAPTCYSVLKEKAIS